MELDDIVFLNTRPKTDAEELSSLLRENGGVVIEFPLLQIVPLGQNCELSDIASGLSPSDWVVFTSANGVRAATAAHPLPPCRIAAIGRKTATVLQETGIEPDFIAQESNAECLARELLEYLHQTLSEQQKVRVFLLRGRIATESLPQLLQHPQVEVRNVVIYDNVLPPLSGEDLAFLCRTLFGQDCAPTPNGLEEGEQSRIERKVEMLIFTSTQAARNLLQILSRSKVPAARWKDELFSLPVAVVGPKTEQGAKELGYRVVVSAEDASMESLVTAIMRYYRCRKSSAAARMH